MTKSYEQQRQEKITQNKKRLIDLGIAEGAATKKVARRDRVVAPKKALTAATPSDPPRRSGRQRAEVNYAEPSIAELQAQAPEVQPPHKTGAADREPLPVYHPPDTCVAPVRPSYDASQGTRDAQGRLVFKDHPEFRPNLTPKQVIQAGSFGGIYFNPRGGKPGIKGPSVAITHQEFPADWFEGLPPKAYRARVYTRGANKYGVKAGQDQAYWEESGWIQPQDPRGWFQWYCRFYMGRRTEDDARQISRWKGVVGDKGRWVRALVNKVLRSNKRYDDATVSPVIRQTLLHWAFELTEGEFERMLEHM